MKLSDLDYKNGEVRILSDLDFTISLLDQIDLLSEDIAQILYPNNYIIDIGWYPLNMKISKNSFFKIFVIRSRDWEHPIKVIRIKTLKELKRSLKIEIDRVFQIH